MAAFPFRLREQARQTALELADLVDDGYRTPSCRIEYFGQGLFIPYRLHFVADPFGADASKLSVLARCLLSRATDGYLRQRAIRSLLSHREAWVLPFIALPIGEYVVEIVDDIRSALPTMDRDAWSNFVRENRATMRLLRSRAVSYWDCYYRHAYPGGVDYPDRSAYPGLIVLKQIEVWGS